MVVALAKQWEVNRDYDGLPAKQSNDYTSNGSKAHRHTHTHTHIHTYTHAYAY